MRFSNIFICIFICIFGFEAQAAKRVTEIERLTREINRNPGNMEMRCALIKTQLANGDTVAADQALTYALKMEEAPCLCMHKARIAITKRDVYGAARYGAKAIKAGLEFEQDSTIYYIDSLSTGAVSMYVQQMVSAEKQNAALWISLAKLAIYRADTIAALTYYENAYHQGDSTAQKAIQNLRAYQTVSDADSVIARIPFTYQDEKIEVKGKINGLAIRITIDTVATESTISRVETRFMLKNDYFSEEDIRNNTAVVIKSLELGNEVQLTEILLNNRDSQQNPVILCLRDLERLGRIRINKQKRVIEIAH